MLRYTKTLEEHIRIADEHKKLLLVLLSNWGARHKRETQREPQNKEKVDRIKQKIFGIVSELMCVEKEILKEYPKLEPFFRYARQHNDQEYGPIWAGINTMAHKTSKKYKKEADEKEAKETDPGSGK